MGGQEQSEVEWLAVRCIICHKIKQPVGQAVPIDLEGMRCDPECPGYTLDPVPAVEELPFERAAPVAVGAPVAADESLDVIGRALIETHFGV